MGYSQLFTYAYLGAHFGHSARIADGIGRFQPPLVNTHIFDNAIIEEIEESKTDRDALNIQAKAHDNVASLFLPILRGEYFIGQSFQFNQSYHHTLPGDASIRFRVFRL